MNDWDSVKGLQILHGRLDFMHIYIYDKRKLVLWCRINSLTCWMQACYDNFSKSGEFTLLTHECDVIIG